MTVTAEIEITFGFEPQHLNFGRVTKNDSPSRTVEVILAGQGDAKVTRIKPSSSYVQARLLDQLSDKGRPQVEITLDPSLPPGRISQNVTAFSNLDQSPETVIRLSGTKIWDIEVTQEQVRYQVSKSQKTDPETKTVTIINHGDRPLKILDAVDLKDRALAEVITIEDGQRYELSITPRQSVWEEVKSTSGKIIIATDNSEQEKLEVRYVISRRP